MKQTWKTNESLKSIMIHVIMIDKVENRWGDAWKKNKMHSLLRDQDPDSQNKV